jgi:hypothetical protein
MRSFSLKFNVIGLKCTIILLDGYSRLDKQVEIYPFLCAVRKADLDVCSCIQKNLVKKISKGYVGSQEPDPLRGMGL